MVSSTTIAVSTGLARPEDQIYLRALPAVVGSTDKCDVSTLHSSFHFIPATAFPPLRSARETTNERGERVAARDGGPKAEYILMRQACDGGASGASLASK